MLIGMEATHVKGLKQQKTRTSTNNSFGFNQQNEFHQHYSWVSNLPSCFVRDPPESSR